MGSMRLKEKIFDGPGGRMLFPLLLSVLLWCAAPLSHAAEIVIRLDYPPGKARSSVGEKRLTQAFPALNYVL